MISGQILRNSIEVLRAAPADPATVDEWNQPAYAAAAVWATGAAAIEPLTMTEVATLTDAGAQVGDYRALTTIEGIRVSDQIRDVDADVTYEIRSALVFRTHTQLLLRVVTD